MKYTVTLAADGSTKICDIIRRSDAAFWQATASIHGTFGSGTVTIQYSSDGGTTKVTGKDFTGNAMSGTAASIFTTQPMGDPNKNFSADAISVYASITGSTAPAIVVDLFDNR